MQITALKRKKIAVIGSGISGLSCAWLLSKAHDVTLFEKDDRPGGHSNTVSFEENGKQIDVDTGFIVFNPLNYPNLVKLFAHLNIKTCDTDMSFAASVDQGRLEYSGSGLAGLLAQKRNLVRPAFWTMIYDILRFYRQSEQLLNDNSTSTLSLKALLEQHGYSDHFIYDHLLPMGAAIWSTPVDQMLAYPASSFLRFCQNHGLVQLNNRPQWQTVVGGSIQYVNAITDSLAGCIQLNSRIQRVIRNNNGVLIEDLHGQRKAFDQVVLACHADQALALLDKPSAQEQALLTCFAYQRNHAILHKDCQLMPKRKAVWSSWNYLSDGKRNNTQQVSVTYWMNKLQPLNTQTPILVSLNPIKEPNTDSIIASFFYDHPLFDKRSIPAQEQLWQLQGQQNTWFCGAYFGYGFHEDGLQAGLAVAEQLGGLPRPWTFDRASSRIHVQTPLCQHALHTAVKAQANG